jgi:hypothetical protein
LGHWEAVTVEQVPGGLVGARYMLLDWDEFLSFFLGKRFCFTLLEFSS